MEQIQVVDVVKKLAGLIDKRKEVEAKVAKMKETEEKLKAYLLTIMNANQQANVRFEGVGRIEKTTRDHAEIVNKDQMAMFMYSEITKAHNEGRPLGEGLALMQARAALGNIEDYIAQGFTLEQMGVAIREKEAVKFVKQ